MHTASEDRLALLRALSARFPTAEAAIAEAAGLRAKLDLPAGIVHVISDVHGEDQKLRHVIHNASGALRKLVAEVLDDRLSAAEQTRFLALLYYPREYVNRFSREIVASGARTQWAFETLSLQFEIVRALRATYRRSHYEDLLPTEYRELFTEMASGQRPGYCRDMLQQLALHDKDWGAVRAAAKLIRNLAVEEILVAGDLGDRGPRMDRVIDILMAQPKVNLLWGNHDTIWMGASLGHDPCILTVLRFSARYRRAAQLEEGYGILTTPLEALVRECYADDPAECFIPKGTGHREPLVVARMQKALAIMQFKAEGRMIERHPEWNLEGRRLLHRIDHAKGTVTIDGVEHPLRDTHLPTIDPGDPYAYSPAEAQCMDRIRESFTQSQHLRNHMTWMVRRGGMWTRRDEVLIFHACVPVNADGSLQTLTVDGREVAGREMMDALATVVRRAFRKRWVGLDEDADWLWYLWCGPRSPLFGKDKITTFESYFIADKATHKEQKNAYFDLMHDAGFIRTIGRLFGCGDDVLVVNGHVPVKVEKGEQPVKRGGNAITIDGAFSEAYGDRGFTLVLRPEGIELAEHSTFSSIPAVIERGEDIVPKVRAVRSFERPRLVKETQEGREVERMIADLAALVEAYQEGVVQEG